ncbi:hypothetical protein GCM10027605_28810 [Micromonospora zhanjiangensis]
MSGSSNPPASCVGGVPRGFQQRQRVATRFGDDPLTDLVVQRGADRGRQQRFGIFVAEAVQAQLWQSGEQVNLVRAGVALCEDQGHPLGRDPACHERQDLCGGLVQPLRVVDEAQQRLFLGDLGEQVEGGQPDQEPVRCRPAAHAERHAEGGLLRLGQHTDPVQQRRAQLVQTGERELGLGLCSDRGLDPVPGSSCGVAGVLQDRGLPDARFPAHHKCPAVSGMCLDQQLLDRVALCAPAQKVRQFALT